MIRADFSVGVEYTNGRERYVHVIVYGSVNSLRAAASEYCPSNDYDGVLGLCHRFTCIDETGAVQPHCAIVRLCDPHIGVGIVSHELAHAAMWMWEMDHPEDPLTTTNDEEFCWTLGSLVKDTVNKMHEYGCYP